MTDFAPFVAAAIRDRVVLDLQKENELLKKEKEALKDEARFGVLFTTCGPGFAAPHYARGSIREAKVFRQSDETLTKRVPIINFDDVPSPETPQELHNTELWVAGRLLGPLPPAYNQAVDLIEQNGESYHVDGKSFYFD